MRCRVRWKKKVGMYNKLDKIGRYSIAKRRKMQESVNSDVLLTANISPRDAPRSLEVSAIL